GNPAPGPHGAAAGVTIALAVFVLATGLTIRDAFIDRAIVTQLGVIAAMGGAGITLAVLQPRGATEVAVGAAVWMAVTRLPLPAGMGLAVGVTTGQDVAVALTGNGFSAVLGATLLSVVLGLVAYLMRQSRASQDQTEMLLAKLEDARDDQMRAAAVAERGRVAAELHDVLAHSLSAASIQLQGARLLADRELADPQLGATIDRTIQLVNDGLANARHAVGALRGERAPDVSQLHVLVDGCERDLSVRASLVIEGTARGLPPDASLALYRGAEEALTNVSRHAPGATATVALSYHGDRTTLSVENSPPAPAASSAGLRGVGGGHGLAGLQERVERAGGTLDAGPSGHGWRVEITVPA
ncbi:MAG: hypothetical protein QOI51_1572, partial [Nocardioidaceae bacterium]|nr:hypothetical protein [Nocardioidaceae bacterium]